MSKCANSLCHTQTTAGKAYCERHEPEDAAPAPKCGVPLGSSGYIAVYCESAKPCPEHDEAGARVAGTHICPLCGRNLLMLNHAPQCSAAGEPVAQSGAGGEPIMATSGHLLLAGMRAEPATGQVGAEPFEEWWESLSQRPPLMANLHNYRAVAMAYAAHVTKGLEADALRYKEAYENHLGHVQAMDRDMRAAELTLLTVREQQKSDFDRAEAAEARNLELMGELERARLLRCDICKQEGIPEQHVTIVCHKPECEEVMYSEQVALVSDLRSRLAEAENALGLLIGACEYLSIANCESVFRIIAAAREEARAALRPSGEEEAK